MQGPFSPTIPALDPPWLRIQTQKLAKYKNGINLGQGVCLLPTPDLLMEKAIEAIRAGHNTYAPAQGVAALREAIADKLSNFNRIKTKPEEVIVTAGSTAALEAIAQVFLKPGDEVILFKPFYPYHYQAMLVRGVNPRFVELRGPAWELDLAELKRAINDKTRFILVCTPNNPTGKVFSRAELEAIGELCRDSNIFCVTDEVYEYITFDNSKHLSLASLDNYRERVITIGSYSKTFAITGWRIGYLAPPAQIYEALRDSCDRAYVCAPTPLQYATADAIKNLPHQYYEAMREQYQTNRQILCSALNDAGFECGSPQGAYYLLANTSKRFPELSSEEISDFLIDKIQIGAVPASDFLGKAVIRDKLRSNFLRFCFAVPQEKLEEAAVRLSGL